MKIIKIKTGEVYIDGKNIAVFETAFEKISKNGEVYYSINKPVFLQEVKPKETETPPTA